MISEPIIPTDLPLPVNPTIPSKPLEIAKPAKPTQPTKPVIQTEAVKPSLTTSTRKTIPDEEIDEDPSFLKILPQKCSNFSPKRAAKKWKKTQRPDVLDLLDKKAKNLTTQTVKRHTWPWLVSLSKYGFYSLSKTVRKVN